VNGRIYVIGGTSTVTEEYDPSSNIWSTKTAIPTARSGLAVVTFQNKVYAIGGFDHAYPGKPTAKNEVYDPATNTWLTKAEMPTARGDICANTVNGQIYVIGGLEWFGYYKVEESNKTEAYDPTTNSWTVKAEMPFTVRYQSSVSIGDKIYVLASQIPMNDTKLPIQIYDTKTDSWSLGSFPPEEQSNADAVAILDERGGGLMYIIGGGGQSKYSDLVQIYDPQNDVWGVGSSMPTPRRGLAVVSVNDQIYALGGLAYGDGNPYGTKVSTNERYTPSDFDFLLPTPTPTGEPQQPSQDMPAGAIFE
jgi:N-acetylneuraminic acid mutarotase